VLAEGGEEFGFGNAGDGGVVALGHLLV
jgi:hypothetical protein